MHISKKTEHTHKYCTNSKNRVQDRGREGAQVIQTRFGFKEVAYHDMYVAFARLYKKCSSDSNRFCSIMFLQCQSHAIHKVKWSFSFTRFYFQNLQKMLYKYQYSILVHISIQSKIENLGKAQQTTLGHVSEHVFRLLTLHQWELCELNTQEEIEWAMPLSTKNNNSRNII